MKLDYVFVNTPADSEKTLELHALLQSYGFTGYVLDRTTETVDDACEKVLHVLVCVSDNICNDTFVIEVTNSSEVVQRQTVPSYTSISAAKT